MPYIYTDTYYRGYVVPLEGETYTTFVNRCVPALRALDPMITEEEARALCDSGWAEHVLKYATEATVVLKRDHDENSIFNDPWCCDWKIADIISAKMPSVSYSSVEKSRAGSGDEFRIAKTAEEKQLVFGWANIAKEADGSYPIDWDGDVTAPDQLENAAYQFVLKYRTTGEQHQGEAVGQLVESIMFTKEKQEALGIPEGILPEGWWVGFYIPDKEVFAKVKKGEYEMFSVQGKAQRVPTGQ